MTSMGYYNKAKRGKLAPLMSEESKKSAGIYLVHD